MVLKVWNNAEKEIDDNDLLELAGNLKKGVPMATLFLMELMKKIKGQLESSLRDLSGQVKLIDGRTEKTFQDRLQ